jgi:hypothetical protein
VHVDKTLLLEKLVDRVGEPAAHSENGAEEVRAWAQVRDFAEKLHRVTLLLKWKRVVGRTYDFETICNDLPFLAASLRGDELATHFDRCAGGHSLDVCVVGQSGIGDHLDVLQA